MLQRTSPGAHVDVTPLRLYVTAPSIAPAVKSDTTDDGIDPEIAALSANVIRVPFGGTLIRGSKRTPSSSADPRAVPVMPIANWLPGPVGAGPRSNRTVSVFVSLLAVQPLASGWSVTAMPTDVPACGFLTSPHSTLGPVNWITAAPAANGSPPPGAGFVCVGADGDPPHAASSTRTARCQCFCIGLT